MKLTEILKKYFSKDQILSNVDVAPYLTSKVSKIVNCIVKIKTIQDWKKLAEFIKTEKLIPGIIGGGSNMVVIKAEHPFYLLNQYRDKKVVSEDKTYVYIKVSSGYNMNALVNETLQLGLSGIEYHLGLPGTVGGAVVMNSKWTKPLAYVGDVVESAEILDLDGNFKTVSADYFNFSYDYSFLQTTKEFLVSVVLKLKKSKKDLVAQRAKSALEYRKQTQPFGVFTAGCFFQNISEELKEKLNLPTTSAGYLIDQCGLKGFSIGDFVVSDKHANFIINRGKGSYQDLEKIIEIIKHKVKHKFGVDLKLEVKLD
ncbi:MAG: UDP-N-acetylenolpyruvoylglucosamine reductase [Patescibacteria group bacterium]|nr:MAG: UDP-N-acetylenolpyruvoylglucosamine reductase [Patescibacteria group bacterium]